MARLIFIVLFLPLFLKAAFVDVVRINPLGNTVQVSGTVNVAGSVSATQSGIWNISSILNPVSVSGSQYKSLGTQLVSGDNGLITQSVIHGLSTGGGGGYVDVKVNPSGSLVADVTGSLVSATVLNQITGFNLESTQLDVLSELQSIDNRLVSPLSVSGTVTANVTFPAVTTVSGSVSVNNPVTSVAVNNFPTFTGLTNTELRASPVVVSGSVIVSTLPNITVVSSALPTNAATQTTQANILSVLQTIDAEVGLGTTTLGEIRDKIPNNLTTSGTRLLVENRSLTASDVVTVANPVTTVSATVLNFPTLTTVSGSVTVSNPVSQVTILNPTIAVTQSTSPWITSGAVTVNNPVTSVSVNNTVSVSTTGTNAVSGFITVNNPVTTVSATILGQQRTPSYTSTTTTGTVSAGAKSVSFYNAGFLNATVLGTTLSAGDTITFQAPDQDTLGAIAYVATGTTLRILEVR